MKFPILNKITYLDNAATTQKPKIVINKIKEYYENNNANIHRGLYDLSEKSTIMYDEAREKVAKLINADKREIIFTKGATESANLLASSLKGKIVLTEMEHHANLIPWQKRKPKFIKIKGYELDYSDAEKKIKGSDIVSIIHVSNVLGTINDIDKIIRIARKNKAITIIDASQSVGHMEVDVKKLDCDFLFFSGHKMFGPTGIGVLYGKYELLKEMPPYELGGDMIEEVTLTKATYTDPPQRFEAGTPNIAGAIGLGKAVDFVRSIGVDKIEKHEKELAEYCIKKMRKIPEIDVYSADKNKGIVSFNIKKIHIHDVASILNEEKICVRAGKHCAHPLIKKLGLDGTVRASFTIYNTKKDVDKLIRGLNKVLKVMK